MVQVGFDEAILLLRRGVAALGAAGVGGGRVVIVVGPLGEVVCEFEPWQVGRGIFKIDDNELFVFILGLQEGRSLVVGADAEDIAVLSLCKRDEKEKR